MLPFGFATLCVTAALLLIVNNALPSETLSLSGYIALFVCAFSGVGVAAIVGSLLDPFLIKGKKTKTLYIGLTTLSFFILFESSFLFDYVDVLLKELSSSRNLLTFIIAVISTVFFVSTLIAATVFLVIACIELPTLFFAGGVVRPLLDGARPILIVAVLSLSFNLIIGLISEELRPITLLRILTAT